MWLWFWKIWKLFVFFVFLTKHFRDSLHRQSQFCLCTFLENLLFTSSCVEAENGRACTYFLDNEIFILSSRDEKVFSFILSSRENKSSISHNNEIISNKTKQLYKIHKSGPWHVHTHCSVGWVCEFQGKLCELFMNFCHFS